MNKTTHTIMTERSGAAEAYFYERVEMYSIPEPNSGCLLWFGPVDSHGYAQLRHNRCLYLVHRKIWKDANNPDIPTHIKVCHRCDVTCCIEERHLFPGTTLDNVADMIAKGRDRPRIGVENGRAKLTEEDVLLIRIDTRRRSVIARSYGVTWAIIDKIKSRQLWKHIP